MLKQAFGQGEKLQEKVVPLFNVFTNRLDNFINTSNKKNVISHCQTRNVTSLWLPGTRRNKLAGYSEIEKGALRKNRVTSHFKIEKGATGRNEVAGYSEKGKRIEDINGDISEVSFLN